MKKTISFTTRLDRQLKESLDEKSQKAGRTPSEHVREILHDYLLE